MADDIAAEDILPVTLVITEVKLGESKTVAEQPIREFLTVFNQSDAEVLLGGWKLEYAKPSFTGACDSAAWSGTGTSSRSLSGVISPGQAVSIDFSAAQWLTDDQSGSLRLVEAGDSRVVIHDLIGWGEMAPCASGERAQLPAKGKSLQRFLDCDLIAPVNTGDNAVDFFISSAHAFGVLGGAALPECVGSGTPDVNNCSGTVLSEIGANLDNDRQFVELYNYSAQPVDLTGCQLQTNRSNTKSYTLGSQSLASGGYLTVFIQNTELTLTKTTSGTVYFLSSDGLTEVDVRSYANLADNTSWAWFGPGDWRQTYTPTPGSENMWQQFLPCPAGQERNPDTGRCRSTVVTAPLASCEEGHERNPETNRCRAIASALTLVACKEGQERNPETNRCRSAAAAASTLQPCAPGQERNPETNRCRKVGSPASADVASVQDIVAPVKSSSFSWWVAGIALAGALGYGAFEWRQEISNLVNRIRRTTTTGK